MLTIASYQSVYAYMPRARCQDCSRWAPWLLGDPRASDAPAYLPGRV